MKVLYFLEHKNRLGLWSFKLVVVLFFMQNKVLRDNFIQPRISDNKNKQVKGDLFLLKCDIIFWLFQFPVWFMLKKKSSMWLVVNKKLKMCYCSTCLTVEGIDPKLIINYSRIRQHFSNKKPLMNFCPRLKNT